MTENDQIYSLPTTIGQAKLTYALATQQTVNISAMAVGDGGGDLVEPDSGDDALVNEVYRAQLNHLYQHADNPNWLVAEMVIPAEVGGWTIRELLLIDDDGDPIFIGNHPEQYKPLQSQGSDETKTIRMVVLVSDVASVTIKTDPTTVFATVKLVDDRTAAHAASRDHPDATTTAKGFVRLANNQTGAAGESTTHALTPASGKALVDQQLSGYGNTVDEKLASLTASLRLRNYFMGQN
tara:strand:+ start:440 stop:1153 length:714 start_codon:yes stop_codon:yes gene_type:complete